MHHPATVTHHHIQSNTRSALQTQQLQLKRGSGFSLVPTATPCCPHRPCKAPVCCAWCVQHASGPSQQQGVGGLNDGLE